MFRYKYKGKTKNSKALRKAVAHAYDKDKNKAPLVVAKGSGHVADKIIEISQEAGIPVYQDESSDLLLSQLQLGQEIPVELYEVVAGILAYILKVNQE